MPPSRRVRALVSIGRYSAQYLRLLERWYWAAGVDGFEEVLLPVACAVAQASPKRYGPCRMSALSSGAGVRSHRMASHFQYRPVFPCETYAAALDQGTRELWHPVKERGCVVGRLGLGEV